MKQITIHIPDNKFSFVMEMLKSLNFIKKVETDSSNDEFITNMTEAIQEVNDIKAGNKQGDSLQSFLNEL